MSLKEQLARRRAEWYQRVPAEGQAVILRHIEALRTGTVSRTMLKVGDRAPAIVLGNTKGEMVDVADLLKKGPVVVAFYRGGWCPYCSLELKALQEMLPQFAGAGASLVAISPETTDNAFATAENNGLTFEVLSDIGHTVGRAFGLVFEFSDELRSTYQGFKIDIPGRNGTPGEWFLPVAATYVVDIGGVISYAYTEIDYRDRADPEEILAALNRRDAST